MLAGFVGIIQVILGFGALIFVHELGHFLVAKRCGVRVDEFSLGFGPYLLTWKKGPTLYALRAIPFGGFVQMRGQNDLDPAAGGDEPDSYNNQSIPKRMAIIVAGVIMNAVFAVVLLVLRFGCLVSGSCRQLSTSRMWDRAPPKPHHLAVRKRDSSAAMKSSRSTAGRWRSFTRFARWWR